MTEFRLPNTFRGLNSVQRILAKSAAQAEPFMITAAAMGVFGHPLFYLIWRFVIPQPYENLTLRVLGSAVCLPIVFKNHWPLAWRKHLPLYWHFGVLFTLPFFFSLYLFFSHFSQVWVLSSIAGIFLLTFIVHWALAALMYALGTAAAYGFYHLWGVAGEVTAPVTEILIVYLFVLCVGGAINYRLQKFRETQAAFEKRLRLLSGHNAMMVREHNQLLGRFLNNIIINRLRKFQDDHGLDEALNMITRQEKRFCAIMQADIRNFTKMFDVDSEFRVAQLISQCFSEITATGQDLAVIKPIGDCLFMYSDAEHGEREAVLNILALASFFVHSVDRINHSLEVENLAPLNFGIAVHAGEVIYGNLASDTMIDPTVIGLNVNKTARMEGLTKSPDIQNLAGSNAVIMSEEFFRFVIEEYGEIEGVIPLNLDQLDVSIRDFPAVKLVYAIPQRTLLAFYPLAIERIQGNRLARAPRFDASEHSAHLGVEYYYEMHGSGPTITWAVFVNVSAFSDDQVGLILQERFSHLHGRISQGDERWLTLSTDQFPGEYDETDVDAWVIDIIERLIGSEETPASHS